jgi:hypothetical protein
VLVKAEKYIMLQVGSSFFRMAPDQITIDAKTVTVQSDAPSITSARGASGSAGETSLAQKAVIKLADLGIWKDAP